MRLKPFFSFFGGKWSLARHYPAPQHETIIEPFAGSAGYSVWHPERRVILIEKDPVIARVWDYLIHVSPLELRRLPDLPVGEDVASLPVCQEAQWLIGFWLNKGHPTPCRTASAWMRRPDYASQFWGNNIRERLASQVEMIRHWQVRCGDYHEAPNRQATWFVDPPYTQQGHRYKCSNREIGYTDLARWWRARQGQLIACEQEGAAWLPFRYFKAAKATGKRGGGDHRSREVVFTK